VRSAAKAAAADLRPTLWWDEALAPLVRFCRQPRRAPDLVNPEAIRRLAMPPGRIPTRDRKISDEVTAVMRHFRDGGIRQLWVRAKARAGAYRARR
jgi:hypothetical protein